MTSLRLPSAVAGLALGASALLATPALAAGEIGGSGVEYDLLGAERVGTAGPGSSDVGGPRGRSGDATPGSQDRSGGDARRGAVRPGTSDGGADRTASGDPSAVTTIVVGHVTDRAYAGDFDGDGADSLAVRRGTTVHLLDGDGTSRTVAFGLPDDELVVGDFDGDGVDTFGVRRGAAVHLTDDPAGGEATRTVVFGLPEDQLVVGDFDGDGVDTFGVRRGTAFHLSDDPAGGAVDRTVHLGRPGDTGFVGDWDGDGTATPAVRRAAAPDGAALREHGGLTGADVPYQASGTLAVVPVPSGAADGRGVHTLRVEVEQGLPVDAELFAQTVVTTLNDPRGWGVRFARTDDVATTRVILASPSTVDRLCAPLDTRGYTSCRVGDRVVLNAARWAGGAEAFTAAGGSLADYRAYLVNHEVGHVLGHGHRTCTTPGRPAHVMQQQTLSMGACTTNAWPA